jgi:Leucine-rich repeat (LRR) protein
MSTKGKENAFVLGKSLKLMKDLELPRFNVNFNNLPRELMITPKLLKDITGKPDLSLITNLNLQFKDERFPKIRRIANLDTVPNLRTLNLSYNMIEKIEGLELPLLVELNLSENNIEVIENLVILTVNI